jgi:hypothetical protein
MESVDLVVGVGLLALALFQAAVSAWVFRSSMYDRQQKERQVWMIWLLPAIGASIALFLLLDETRSRRA